MSTTFFISLEGYRFTTVRIMMVAIPEHNLFGWQGSG